MEAAKPCVYIHMFVKNSNYLNVLVRDSLVKNYMATLRKFLIIWLNIIAVLADRRAIGKQMERIIKLLNIHVTLRTAPAFFREFSYIPQISFGAFR